MIKKYLKKAGISLLVMVMTLGIAPIVDVYAAEYGCDAVEKGTILHAGDILTTASDYNQVLIYYYNSDLSQRLNFNSANTPYTIKTVEGISTWKVHVNSPTTENSIVITLVESTEEAKAYTATLDITGLAYSSAKLSKTTEITADDTVTVTITPENGKAFTTKPTVSVDGATAGEVTKQANGTYTCVISAFTKNATVKVSGEAIADPTPEKPAITAGLGSVHQIGTEKDMIFTCTGKLEDLEGIYVDGKQVDSSNYTLKSGSTILTLKKSYLDTLTVGKHSLKFQYKGNLSATTEFSVVEKGTPVTEDNKPDTPVKNTTAPSTGDTSNIMLMFSMLILSGGAISALAFKKKRKVQ